MYIYVRQGGGSCPPVLMYRNDYRWVDHWVDQKSALTCAIKSGVLCIASVTCWAGAFVRKHTPSSGTSLQFRGSRFTVQVSGFLKFTFEDEKDCRQGCIQGHRTICTAEISFFTSHGMYYRILNLGSIRTKWWYHCTRDR